MWHCHALRLNSTEPPNIPTNSLMLAARHLSSYPPPQSRPTMHTHHDLTTHQTDCYRHPADSGPAFLLLYLGGVELELFRRRPGRLSAKTVEQGLDLQNLGRRTFPGFYPGHYTRKIPLYCPPTRGRRQGEKNRANTPNRPRNQHGGPKLGYAFVHTVIDDHSRVAYTEVQDDETAVTSVGVLHRAVEWFAEHGVTIERILSDNGSAYRSYLCRDPC